jgi:antirestriction protein ArdC
MSAKSPRRRLDVHQAVTAKIIDAIEAGAGPFQLPWIQPTGAALERPTNIETRAAYNGINALVLWIEALARGYASSLWGTFRQWRSRGAQVRKGETASLIVFYRPLVRDPHPATDEDEGGQPRLVIRASHVFNACQVDGFEATEAREPCAGAARPAALEGFVKATGARVLEGGLMAAYDPKADQICIPPASAFVGTATSSPTESYYATLCHELVHWSGAKHRLARDLTGRFGSQAYAMEELIAELGAAFLCADLGVTPQPRADHAAYIQSWLEVLKADKRAIFTAASKASQAAEWLENRGAP